MIHLTAHVQLFLVTLASQQTFVSKLHWTVTQQVAFQNSVIPSKKTWPDLDFQNRLYLDIL